ncbi:MAG: UvrB/UvrC motif-containing protein [Kiritimatiellae bacterium]|nr:UvrB/UvrC motif-containing protein [Kiritimatiellia bacterium]MDD4340758.1 UvrB/UvrC motif-containing protein [Kiritimatiellia bacterium]
MLCENCQQNPATVHVTQIVDGKVAKFHLCETCAQLKGLDVPEQALDLGNMLETLKEQLNQLQTASGPATLERAVTCPVCGTTRTEILKTGRMGCDHCYEAFTAEMLPVVMSLQHAEQHMGKVPQRSSKRMKASVEWVRLRRELEQAVAGENYEQAAHLRDQIKALTPVEAPT